MSKPRNLGHQFRPVNQMHEDLRPLKETLKAKGISFASVAGHLTSNAHIIFGKKVTKDERLAFAIRKHAEDPDNFPKNIGYK